jgi:hypothetical protein
MRRLYNYDLFSKYSLVYLTRNKSILNYICSYSSIRLANVLWNHAAV